MNKDFFSLEDKVVIITGAAGLLGQQHADAVASFGGTPILIDIAEGPLKKLERELNHKYAIDSISYVVNISNEEEIQQNYYAIIKRFPKIDALVNNAANNPKVEDESVENFSRLENFSINDWDSDLAVGLTGAFLCAKYYGKAISNNPNGGSIINISSDLGLIGPDQRLYEKSKLTKDNQPVKPVSYSVIKHGLIGLTKYLATYWADRGVRCNALCPGGIYTGQSKEFVEKLKDLIPLGRMANVDEYQAAIIFLISDASLYMNGANLTIDGGRSIW
jgi:NAD(P)-dependent dehydrogenase (short-subunit alcohol dehydrogenase family)